jgi:DNA-binding response OmpR family regulator
MGWLGTSARLVVGSWLPARWTSESRHRLPLETIVVVGSPELRPRLEDVVGPGSFRVMFLEEFAGAHSRIMQTMPDRVVLCCHVDDLSGFQLLSMLQTDSRTRKIPALTFIGAEAVPDESHES